MRDDDNLLDLIDRAALEELTPEQCAAIRAAAATSPAIRQACLDRIGLEERLAATLGRPRVSVDELLAGRRRIAESRLAGRWLAPVLLTLLVTGVTAAIAWRVRGPREDEVAVTKPDTEKPPIPNAEPLPGAGAGAGRDGADRAGDQEPQPPDPLATAAVADGQGRSAPTPPAPPAPAVPWAQALAADAPEPTVADLFRSLPLRPRIDKAELETWFAPLPGERPKFGTVAIARNAEVTTMAGRFRLVPPLGEGVALRVLVSNPNALRIVAWSGNSAAAIEAEGPAESWRWCGSVLSRPAADKPAAARWLASTSDARGHRSGAGWSNYVPFTGILELRYTERLLVLSRGEVRLVEVPLPAAPDEVLFEGAMTIGGVELVRSVSPPPLPESPPATTAWRPADLAWEGAGATAIVKRPDGSVRLAQAESAPKAPLITTWNLPAPEFGPRELIVRLDDFTPGTGVVLGGPEGKQQIVCGFVAPTAGGPPDRQGNLFLTWSADKSPLTAGDPKNLGFAFAPRPVWLRFQVGDSMLTISWSGDGRHWARLRQYPQVWTATTGAAISSIGLFAGAHPGRSITLGEVAVAELPAFARLLPRDILPAVNAGLVPVSDAKRGDDWVAATLQQKPEGVEESRWLAAAAIRCLAMGRTNLTDRLCSLVWRHARSLDLPAAEQLDLCDDIQRLLPGSMNQHNFVMGCIHGVVARDCVDKGDVAGYRTAWLRLQQAPGDFTWIIPFNQQVDPLGVRSRQLWRRFTAGPADALATEVARRRLDDNGSRLAEAIARRTDPITPLRIETPTPLYNAVVTFEAAITAEAWSDALRAMSAITAATQSREELFNLAPEPRDGDRLVTLPQMMADALSQAAGFREFMLREQAERGRLRVLQLRADGDERGLAAAAIEFQGTPAAAEALQWLAERALAAGDFTGARASVDRGLQWASPEVRDRLLTTRAVAEALAGAPVTALPAATGIATVPAAEVAALAASSATGSTPPTTKVVTFPPADLDAVQRLALGPASQKPSGVADYPDSTGGPFEDRFVRLLQSPPLFCWRVDWAAETCSFTATPDRLLVNNRLELVAVDPVTGAEQWRTPTGPKPGGLTDCGLVPMRATCDRQHAYVRTLAGGGSPRLTAVRLTDGTIAWDVPSAANAAFVSDPVLLYGTLWVCEAVAGSFEDQLSLVAIDPETGSRRRQRPISGLTRAWRVARPGRGADAWDHGDCQLAAGGDRLFVAAAGTVLACDADGCPVWLRRQPWLGPEADGWWRYQAQTPPLIDGDTLFVIQPGVQAVTAIDAGNGRLRWRTPLSEARRLIGLAGSGTAARLVVETAEGIVSVDPQTGDGRTILDARDGSGDAWLGIAPTRLLGATLATADGHAIVAVQRRTTEPNKPDVLDVAILWIDVVSGAVVKSAELPALAGNPPWVGPLASAGGSLWLLAHQNPADIRRSLWQLSPRKK